MKKILVIGLSPILGGVETYIYNVVKVINKNKFCFDFLIIGEKKSVFEDEIKQLYADYNSHFYYCPNIKKQYFKTRKWLKEFSKNHKYDFVYLNTCTAAKYQYCSPFLKNGSKLISHSHSGSGSSKINNGIFKCFLRKKSIYKLACSDVAGRWLYGKHCKDFIVIPNGVDVNRFCFNKKNRVDLRKKMNLNEKDILIGHVGRFDITKNQVFFIELAKLLPEKYKFLLIGNGETKKEILEKIDKFKLNKRFIVLEAKNDIEKYYSAMDIFAMPSLYEGLPIVSVEAQANGLSCIFSDTVSKQSDLSNHCIFFPLNNIIEWKNYIENNSFERYDGRIEICKRKFDIESTVLYLERIFDSEIGGKMIND